MDHLHPTKWCTRTTIINLHTIDNRQEFAQIGGLGQNLGYEILPQDNIKRITEIIFEYLCCTLYVEMAVHYTYTQFMYCKTSLFPWLHNDYAYIFVLVLSRYGP